MNCPYLHSGKGKKCYMCCGDINWVGRGVISNFLCDLHIGSSEVASDIDDAYETQLFGLLLCKIANCVPDLTYCHQQVPYALWTSHFSSNQSFQHCTDLVYLDRP